MNKSHPSDGRPSIQSIKCFSLEMNTLKKSYWIITGSLKKVLQIQQHSQGDTKELSRV